MSQINDLMYDIGVSGYFHDSSVALFKNGQLIDFVKEEDIVRVKGVNGFPFHALKYLIKKYSLSNSNISTICFYEKPLKSWLFLLEYFISKKRPSIKLFKKHVHNFWDGSISFGRNLNKLLKVSKSKIYYSDHHASHVMSALPFVPNFSPSNKYLTFTFDAYGDGISSSISQLSDGVLYSLHSNIFPNSLGLFYSAFTQFLGFLPNDGEYKIMALAAFGRPIFFDFILKEILLVNGPNHTLNMDWFSFDHDEHRYFSDKFIEKFGPCAMDRAQEIVEGNSLIDIFADIAASAQAALEFAIKSSIAWGVATTGINNITISGGVAQNCVAVSKIADLVGVNLITVPPSPGDSGAAIGAVNFARLVRGQTVLPIENWAFGSNNFDLEVLDELFEKIENEDPISAAAKLVDNGEIVTLFDIKHELGPRALGYRSIICDAGNETVVSLLNIRIKRRENFRPLAPAILDSNVKKYFYLPPKLEHNYFWMGATCKAQDNFPQKYSAALHIDKSARIQIISDTDSLLYKLASLTCSDVLINTSFNIAGDPIIFDYTDAFMNMTRMGISYMLTTSGLYKTRALGN